MKIYLVLNCDEILAAFSTNALAKQYYDMMDGDSEDLNIDEISVDDPKLVKNVLSGNKCWHVSEKPGESEGETSITVTRVSDVAGMPWENMGDRELFCRVMAKNPTEAITIAYKQKGKR